MASIFTHKPKASGNVILAQDWNTAMDEIVRLSGDSLSVAGGTINGDVSVTGTGTLSFGAQKRQMVSLSQSNHGVGVQTGTQYFRTDKNFAWYKGARTMMQNSAQAAAAPSKWCLRTAASASAQAQPRPRRSWRLTVIS